MVNAFSIAGVVIGPDYFLRRPAMCHVIGAICLISCAVSLWSITAISVNRYILLCRTAIYRRIYTWRNTVLMAIGLWMLAALLDLPNFFGWGNHSYDMKTMACSYDRTASYSYTLYFITVFFSIPLFAVVYCNVSIYLLVARSRARVSTHSKTIAKPVASSSSEPASTLTKGGDGEISSEQGKLKVKNQKKEVNLAKTLFIIFVAFSICWAPYAVLVLMDKHDRVVKEAYSFAILLAHLSSTTNSIVYAVTNKSFRDGYKVFLGKVSPCWDKK